ncbi:MAG: formylglycine-generating enzyme family protein [Deltaproteobacteria bacterium]|jgi:formylglycine-generating enzyme required for sulfatase activity|nr:formylglycine-generating enzyme family protein [Deltaproteobacteria bacterium]
MRFFKNNSIFLGRSRQSACLIISFATALLFQALLSGAGVADDNTRVFYAKKEGFVFIRPGNFMMGPSGNSTTGTLQEKYQTRGVLISKPFYLSEREVTQAEWNAVMDANPSLFKGDSLPVDNVSTSDVKTFLSRLNEREKTTGYRLPTEAEFEYALRAGTTTEFFFGDDEQNLDLYAWYRGNSENHTHPVGSLNPNPWGLYDMNGNVEEWVSDYFELFSGLAAIDPTGPVVGYGRVIRGCSWRDIAVKCKSGRRAWIKTNEHGANIGLRLAFTAVPLTAIPEAGRPGELGSN